MLFAEKLFPDIYCYLVVSNDQVEEAYLDREKAYERASIFGKEDELMRFYVIEVKIQDFFLFINAKLGERE
jgi:hypothetical protein